MRRHARILLTASLAAGPVMGVAVPATMVTPAAATGGHHVLSVRLNGFEAQLAADINKARRSAGLRPLTVIAGSTDVARRWSRHMAAAQGLSHNPPIIRDISH